MARKAAKQNGGKAGFYAGRWHDAGLSGITGILGQPGTGKSFLMAQLIASCRRLIIVDTVHQYGPGPRQNRLPSGFVVITQPGQLVEFWRARRRGPFRVLYQPGTNLDEHFDAVLRLALEVRDVVIAVDEIWWYCKPGWLPEPLKFICRAGRHRGVTLLYTAQRPAIISADLRSMTNQWRVFRLTNGLDLAALRGELPEEFLRQVPSLPDRVHVARDEFGNCTVLKPAK